MPMRAFVWKGSWAASEALFARIVKLLKKDVTVEDLNLDPFVINIENGSRADLASIGTSFGVQVRNAPPREDRPPQVTDEEKRLAEWGQ